MDLIKSISIIFPLYNEEKRLLINLKEIEKLYQQFNIEDLEIILVNDGSTDNSNLIINNFLSTLKDEKTNVPIYISYKKNMGKGFALKKGVSYSTKDWILTCDIDFSTHPKEIFNWINGGHITNNKNCYIASRTLKNSKINYRYHRKFLGRIFSYFVNVIFNLNIGDTQCGFKLYHKAYAKKIFSDLKEFGYAHDVEIIVLLTKSRINILELPIEWTHKAKGNLNPIIDGFLMMIKLIFIKFRR